MDKLKVHVSAGGDARMSPLWWVEMSIEKIVADILNHLNLRYQGSLLFKDAESLVLKELTWEPIGYGAGRIGNDLDGAIKRGLYDKNIGISSDAGISHDSKDNCREETMLVEVKGYDPRINSRRCSVKEVVNAILDHLNLTHDGGFNDELFFGFRESDIGTPGYIAGQIYDVIEGSCDPKEHQKVFKSNDFPFRAIGSMRTWICSVCGVRGSEPIEYKADEYEELVKKFHENKAAGMSTSQELTTGSEMEHSRGFDES